MTGPWRDDRVMTGLTRQLMLRRRMLADGANPIGWKVAFGSPTSLDLMEISAPFPGFLTDATVIETGATVPIAGWNHGVIEFEVAVYLAADVGPGASADQARAAVSAVGAAIELADVDLPIGPEHVEDIVAGGIFHTGLVLGEPDPSRAGLDTNGMRARIECNGVELAATSKLEAITGAYPEIVATVATTLAAAGEPLRAGDLIITGSVIPPVPIDLGQEYTFTLEPLDPIAVRIG